MNVIVLLPKHQLFTLLLYEIKIETRINKFLMLSVSTQKTLRTISPRSTDVLLNNLLDSSLVIYLANLQITSTFLLSSSIYYPAPLLLSFLGFLCALFPRNEMPVLSAGDCKSHYVSCSDRGAPTTRARASITIIINMLHWTKHP